MTTTHISQTRHSCALSRHSCHPFSVILGLDPRIQNGCDKWLNLLKITNILDPRVKPEDDAREGKDFTLNSHLRWNNQYAAGGAAR